MSDYLLNMALRPAVKQEPHGGLAKGPAAKRVRGGVKKSTVLQGQFTLPNPLDSPLFGLGDLPYKLLH